MNKKSTKQPIFTRISKSIKHPAIAIPLLTITLLFFLAFVGYYIFKNSKELKVSPNTRIVIITHDGVKQVVPSEQDTVGALLSKLQISINKGDVVEPALATQINQDDFRINIYRAKPVKIVDGSNVATAFSAAATPRAIAVQSGLALYPEDGVNISPTDNFLAEQSIGAQIVVLRATPFNLNLYGNQLSVRTLSKTVGGYIKEQNIKLAKNDQVSPALSTPITPGLQVNLILNGVKTVTIKEIIPTPIQTIYDNNLAYGTSAVRQAGSPGQKVVTYRQTLQNNAVVSEDVLSSITITNPVTQIVVVGTSLSGIKGDMALAGISPTDYNYADYIISRESGWCPTKAQGEHYCPASPDNQNTSGGYGLCQATPGNKMSSAGSDWATNPITQLRWCNGYAVDRYGGWYGAYTHWLNNGNW